MKIQSTYWLILILFFCVACSSSSSTSVISSPDTSQTMINQEIPTSTVQAATATPTIKPTTAVVKSSPTAIPRLTLSPTRSGVMTVTVSPTHSENFSNVASCIPKDTPYEKGTVTKVIDGDTVYVRLSDGKNYSVRYIGIDSPEIGRPYYQESTNYNSDLVLNNEVILVQDVSEVDQFDRLLRYVIVGDTFINLEMVKAGFAVAETYPPDIACADTLTSIESESRSSNLGLWKETEVPSSGDQVIIVAMNKREEWVDIKNVGATDIDLSGWNLVSEKGNQDCPLSGVIKSGEILRIWAMAAEGPGFSCGYNTTIWNNSEPDPAVLYNPEGVEISRLLSP